MDEILKPFVSDMFGHNWLEWVGIFAYFISIATAMVAFVALALWIVSTVYEALNWKWIVYKTRRFERKEKEARRNARNGKH